MSWLDGFYGPNAGYVVELHERYQRDPNAVDSTTRAFFAGWQSSPTTPLAAPDRRPRDVVALGQRGNRCRRSFRRQ